MLAKKDPGSGELRGVAVDLARELGTRIHVPVELVGYDSAGKMFEAVKAGAWDVAFLAIDPGRADEIDFTAPYVEIEGTYLVPAGTPYRVVGDVDEPDVRIGVSAKSAYDLFLSRSIQHAELIHASGPDAAFALLLAGKVDVLAGVRQHLVANAAKIRDRACWTIGSWRSSKRSALSKAASSAKYLREFIEDVKASGLVKRALEKSGVSGVSIAPAAPTE